MMKGTTTPLGTEFRLGKHQKRKCKGTTKLQTKAHLRPDKEEHTKKCAIFFFKEDRNQLFSQTDRAGKFNTLINLHFLSAKYGSLFSNWPAEHSWEWVPDHLNNPPNTPNKQTWIVRKRGRLRPAVKNYLLTFVLISCSIREGANEMRFFTWITALDSLAHQVLSVLGSGEGCGADANRKHAPFLFLPGSMLTNALFRNQGNNKNVQSMNSKSISCQSSCETDKLCIPGEVWVSRELRKQIHGHLRGYERRLRHHENGRINFFVGAKKAVFLPKTMCISLKDWWLLHELLSSLLCREQETTQSAPHVNYTIWQSTGSFFVN